MPSPSISICPPGLTPGTKHFTLIVQEVAQTLPGGVIFLKALSYNGSLNGPTIDVNLGDDVSIDVINNASIGTTVHWHGQDQNGSSWSDGVAFVTQVPIPPMGTFRYRFKAGPAGTMMYHSHTDTQYADGLRGVFIVRDPIGDPWLTSYDEERLLMLTDPTPNPSSDELLALQMGSRKMGMGMGTNPCSKMINQDFSDSVFFTLLTNGKGWDQNGNGAPEVIKVQKGQRYRLRFVNGASNWAIKVNVSFHSMDVIAINGGIIVRISTQGVISTSGERFDVILTADQTVGNYWIHISTLEGLNSPAILSYEGAVDPLTDPKMKPPPLQLGCQALPLASVMDLKSLLPNAHPSSPSPPQKADETLAIYLVNLANPGLLISSVLGNNTNIQGLSKGLVPSNACPALPSTNQTAAYCWTLNWINFITSTNKVPFLYPGSHTSPRTYVQPIPLDSVVDIVLINPSFMVHPMHLHGQQFFVLGSGNGSPFLSNNSRLLDYSKLNILSPGLRDTFAVPQAATSLKSSSTTGLTAAADGRSYGWAVLRFKASNAGVWAFHCHIDLHAASGMFMAFEVSKNEWSLPRGIESCRKG